MTWDDVWLILHILAAIVGFGPMFAFGTIASRGGHEPRHSLFATELVETIGTRLTLPAALVVLITGFLLVNSMDIDFFASEWLWISVVLYVLALAFAVLVQRPTELQMVRIMKELESAPPPTDGTGPPPQLARLIRRSQIGGVLLSLAVVAILVLMVWKPGAAGEEHEGRQDSIDVRPTLNVAGRRPHRDCGALMFTMSRGCSVVG